MNSVVHINLSHYSASHCLQDPKPQKMLLSGYGVELAIKNTEYKAVDDTKVKGQLVTYQTFCAGPCCAQSNKTQIFYFVDSKMVINAEDDDNDEVQGFIFGTLK